MGHNKKFSASCRARCRPRIDDSSAAADLITYWYVMLSWMWVRSIVVAVSMIQFVNGDTKGSGISKTTYSGSQALIGVDFNEKYFPVYNTADSCEDNICDCTIADVVYVVDQGRCDLNFDKASGESDGFGLHLVNCSTNGQPGGMTTAQVEAEFATKLGNLTKYDSFMDFNVALLTSNLNSYVSTFDENEINYLPIEFPDQNKTYYGIIILVPESQMIIEVVQAKSQTTSKITNHPNLLKMKELRHPHATLKRAEAQMVSKQFRQENNVNNVGDIMVALTLSRAASNLTAISEFYLKGMQTTETLSYDDDDVSKRCYLWTIQGATVDVCFVKRSDDATSTDFKVIDFENMLKNVHENIMETKSTTTYGCNNKWMDNHYAVDSDHVSGNDYIINYLDETEGLYVYCNDHGFHYMTDPTGWGIQIDMNFSIQPAICFSQNQNSSSISMAPTPSPTTTVCPCTAMIQCGASGGY